MKPFRDRSQVVIGAICVGLLVAGVLAAFQLENISGMFGTKYRAAFADASGLTTRDEVRIAGVKVGKVTKIGLAGFKESTGRQRPYVEVQFRVDGDVSMGTKTKAVIAVKTLVGQKYLALQPAGPGEMSGGDLIPRSRTVAPFDVVDAFSSLAETVTKIDVEQLKKALTVLSDTFEDTPPHVKSSLEGLSRLSKTVASRDKQLQLLLKRTQGVTKVLAERSGEFRKLVKDANLLLDEVSKRKDAIHRLLVATDDLATQLSGVAKDNRKQLGPALKQLRGVAEILRKNKTNLEKTLKNMGPYIKAFTNVVGNGRWFDNYIDGLLQPYTPSGPTVVPEGGSRPGSAAKEGGR
ncbi:MAG: MCE family protein [Micromonosporaceae bacterium]|nr:MCE family protein [Micromonosporaceae bacterium]